MLYKNDDLSAVEREGAIRFCGFPSVRLPVVSTERGDFLTIAMQGDFGKPGPALVIQADQFDEHATVTVLAVTSTLVAR